MKASVLAIVLLAAACSEQRGIPGGSLVGATGADGLPGKDGAPGVTGAPGRDGEGNVEGARLKHVYWHGADGSKTLAHIEDSKYATQCVMKLVGDEMRCAFPSGYAFDMQYSDAGCTEPLLTTGSTMTLLKGEAFGGRFWIPGAKMTGTRYQGTPTLCTEVTSPAGDAYTVTEVPFSDFVLLTKGGPQ